MTIWGGEGLRSIWMGERWLGMGMPWLSSLVRVTGEWKEPLGMVSRRVWIQPCLDSFPVSAAASGG